MADLSDVETAIVNLIGGLIYPNGPLQPSALPSATPARIRRGWPVPAPLDADLAAGTANITVFSRGGTELNTTRYPVDYQEMSRQTATVSASVSGNQITIAGGYSASVTQFVTLQIGPRIVVTYTPVAGDTAASIVAALAGLISSTIAPASASGAVITVTTGMPIRAIVGVTGSQIAEIRRQRTQIQITLWCSTPAVRDAIAVLIEPILSAQTFLTMPDSSAARFRYNNTIVSDAAEKVNLYRRDLIYSAEYATTLVDTGYEVTVVTVGDQYFNNGINNPTAAPAVPESYPLPQAPAPVNQRVPFQPIVDRVLQTSQAVPAALDFSQPGNSQYLPAL